MNDSRRNLNHATCDFCTAISGFQHCAIITEKIEVVPPTRQQQISLIGQCSARDRSCNNLHTTDLFHILTCNSTKSTGDAQFHYVSKPCQRSSMRKQDNGTCSPKWNAVIYNAINYTWGFHADMPKCLLWERSSAPQWNTIENQYITSCSGHISRTYLFKDTHNGDGLDICKNAQMWEKSKSIQNHTHTPMWTNSTVDTVHYIHAHMRKTI